MVFKDSKRREERMSYKQLLAIAVLATSSTIHAEEPIATQAGRAIDPIAQKAGKAIHQTTLEYFAGTKGMLGDGAREALKQQQRSAQQNQIGNTNITRSLRDCMKPGNVVDDEVKACTEGRLEKTW
jgi:hypothetical protein